MNDKMTLSERVLHSMDDSGRKVSAFESLGKLVKDTELIPALSEKGKTTVVKSTQDSISSIHKITIENTAGMTAKSIEAIANIGIAHESKASESIQAIERMTIAGQQSLLKESKSSKKGVFGAAFLALGAIGGALGVYQRIKK
ncbi:hypothetical protein WKG93_05980 [Pantoea agglomerans]|uniref:hypothetical protein n=1 Tax=Enterobacter agglomerans TaxID=549 RepID=UPI0023AF6899|nr:hypothetical protein [Pantoea agglomerans]WEC71184.1 hypothetical protein LDO72_12110 [Pantoea agglomerans]